MDVAGAVTAAQTKKNALSGQAARFSGAAKR